MLENKFFRKIQNTSNCSVRPENGIDFDNKLLLFTCQTGI